MSLERGMSVNEIALSNDLKQIEFEINHHKNIAGQSIWEIGRRLNHVKENDLAHGQFMDWVESIGIPYREANRMMVVANELPNVTTWSTLGTRALYLIATLPEDEKQGQLDRVEKGDNPTVRELQELKRQLKEKDDSLMRQLHEKDEVIEKSYQKIKELSNQPPKIIEQTVERLPEDYHHLKKSYEEHTKQLKSLTRDLNIEKTKYDLLEKSTFEAKELERKINALKTKEMTLVEKIEAIETFSQLEKGN